MRVFCILHYTRFTGLIVYLEAVYRAYGIRTI
jgi:hypothetical protein